MALHNNSLAMDPAYTKYNNMVVNRHKYFRWTARTGWLTIAYVVAFPAFIGYLGMATDGKWDMRGKRRGDLMSEF